MPAPTVLPCDFADFFAPIAVQLLALRVVADAALIVPTATDEVPHYNADRDVLLWPQGELTNAETAAGGGRYDTRSTATLFVVARSRLELDEAVSSRSLLLDSSLGHYGFRAAIRNALQLFWPQDAQRNLLGVQPMRWVRTHPPVKDPRARGWVSSTLEFEVVYPVALSPAEF